MQLAHGPASENVVLFTAFDRRRDEATGFLRTGALIFEPRIVERASHVVMNYGETEDFAVSCFAEAWLTSPVGLPAGAAEAFLSTGASPRSAGVP